jgi:D-arabinose 1-dehydrogenase-like Zn-dependent alcohol dehydrogenase
VHGNGNGNIPTDTSNHKSGTVSSQRENADDLPVVGTTALQGLRDHGELQAGQHVLINEASGSVASFAVQVAKALGAEVTAVCSTRNVETARSVDVSYGCCSSDPWAQGHRLWFLNSLRC